MNTCSLPEKQRKKTYWQALQNTLPFVRNKQNVDMIKINFTHLAKRVVLTKLLVWMRGVSGRTQTRWLQICDSAVIALWWQRTTNKCDIETVIDSSWKEIRVSSLTPWITARNWFSTKKRARYRVSAKRSSRRKNLHKLSAVTGKRRRRRRFDGKYTIFLSKCILLLSHPT